MHFVCRFNYNMYTVICQQYCHTQKLPLLCLALLYVAGVCTRLNPRHFLMEHLLLLFCDQNSYLLVLFWTCNLWCMMSKFWYNVLEKIQIIWISPLSKAWVTSKNKAEQFSFCSSAFSIYVTLWTLVMGGMLISEKWIYLDIRLFFRSYISL